ncbi:TfoX/Sxy family DNA transformation protein [Vibrio parahaemolyticus]|nr:TfoX/Sxy family DNA transformation protein [Vibrio parahaemolyticus]UPR14580.1 TfoX/Sxy family DNA transformation protein [Vibrio parahaemolyticus]
MTLTKERMLKTVGILSVSELISSGPALSFVLLSQSYSNLSYRLLYELEGAINNNYWSVVSVERRKELVSELEVLNSIAAKGDVRQAQTEAYQAAHN